MKSLLKRKFFLILKRFSGLLVFRKSRIKYGFLFVILVIGAVSFPLTSMASPALGDMGVISGGIMDMLINLALGLGEFFIKMSIFFLRFFIALAQYNNYIDSPVVKLGWLMVRDVVNMFFVVILLVIAIGTILGMEQYQWNKTLVKLILSAVFVNFSNLISQLFIDAAHVFTLTFASAISATAGGNLINMFHFEKIYAITTGKNDVGVGGESFNLMGRTLIASIVAMLFALLAMLVMGAYAIMMLLRMTVLWVLIILSPLAFLFLALPQTANRYGEWWKEFSNYVVLAPTISFFMWLAFATAGSGTLGTDLGITDSMMQDGKIDSVGALTLSTVTTWENMANFLVAIGLLFVGLQEVQKLNVAGGSVASKAKDFFGKVATIATGYAAGRWLAGKAVQGAKAGVGLAWKGTKTAAWYGVRGENIKNWAKWNVEAFKAWRNKTGYGPVMEKKMVRNWKTGEMEEKWVAKRYTEGPKKGMVVMGEVPARFGGLQKWFHERAVTDAFSAKRLRRMTDFNKNREDLLQARVSANPSHGLFMVEWETKGLVKKGVPMDIARFEKGEIKAEKARSEGKTGRYEAMGQKAVATQKRYKIKKDDKTGRLIIGFEDEGTGGTLNEQMAEHEIEKEAYEASLAAGKAEARLKYAEKVTGEGEKPGREALELASDMKKEAETAKIREDLIKEGIEIAESKEAKEEFVQKGEQEAKLDETLISEAAKKLSGVIKTLDADIEARQEEVIGNIIKEEIKAEDQFSIDKKEAKGAIEKFGEKKKILLETDAKMKEWADIRDGARSEVESKENEIATAKEDLGKEKDPKKQAGVREKIEQLKQDLAEKEAILAGIEKDKPVELGTLEDPIEKAGKRLKEIEREQKMSQIKFGVEKEKSISGDEVLRSKKAEREGKAKKLEEEEKEYQKTDKYKTGAAEVRLKKIYIEGGEEALSRELKNSEPALGEEELRQVVRFKREEYDSAGYTGGFQTVEARKMASTFALEKEKSALKALEAEAKEKALGVSGIRSLFEEAQVGQILAEAADKFVERIKQVDLEKIFKTGLSDMAKETKINKTIKEQEIKAIKATGAEQERLRAETAKLRTEIQRLHLTAGARMARGETAANYAKEATTIVRQELVDNADSEYSRERYGFDTPATAYKALIKKKMEDYSGVEREQSIRQSFDSLGKLLRLTTKGEDAGRDQTAMAMAGITYLTKQAWSDDLLNLIVDQIQAGAQGKLTGEEREVAEVMKSVFIDKFGWGKVKEDGTINIVSESSNRWTNDLHRLLGRAGNVDNLMAENASLRVMDQTGNGMSAVNEVIVERLRAKAKGSGVDVKEKGWEKQLRSKLGEEEYDEFSKSLGFDGEKAKKELEALARTFVTGTSSVGEAVENFKDSLKRDFEALQMLADAKNAAMSVAHLDDGGHTIYDVNEGVFRGQTAENAMKFILSDWRKIGADERIRRLKIHSVAQMNEHTGTIRIDERNLQAIEETFAGTDTELIFNKSDGRNVDQISGLAAGEKAIIDSKTGRMVLGDENSKMVAETFGHIADAKERQAAALQQIADNCASMLTSSGSTVFLTASLGKRSNLAYVESTQGQFNLQLPDGKTITTTEEFLKFVEEHRSKENKNTVHINRAQVLRTFQSKQKQFGKGPDKQKKKQKEDEDVDE